MILSSQMKNMTIIGLFLVREDQCQDINCIHDCYLRQARWHITNLVEKMSYVGPFLVINWLVFKAKKNICVFPIDPKILTPTNIFYAKKRIDRQNPEIHLRFRLQQFSSFPCTFDRCLEPKTLSCMSNN